MGIELNNEIDWINIVFLLSIQPISKCTYNINIMKAFIKTINEKL